MPLKSQDLDIDLPGFKTWVLHHAPLSIAHAWRADLPARTLPCKQEFSDCASNNSNNNKTTVAEPLGSCASVLETDSILPLLSLINCISDDLPGLFGCTSKVGTHENINSWKTGSAHVMRTIQGCASCACLVGEAPGKWVRSTALNEVFSYFSKPFLSEQLL